MLAYVATPQTGNIDRTRIDTAADFGGHYTAYVRIKQDPPPIRERNTIYRLADRNLAIDSLGYYTVANQHRPGAAAAAGRTAGL